MIPVDCSVWIDYVNDRLTRESDRDVVPMVEHPGLVPEILSKRAASDQQGGPFPRALPGCRCSPFHGIRSRHP